MTFFLNELSLHGQFNSLEGFLSALQEILKCRAAINQAGFPLYCDRKISLRPALREIIFQNAVMLLSQRDVIRIVMSWLSKEGPFWDDIDEREHTSDEYFAYGEEVITDSSLAEAAFRVEQGRDCNAVSFQPSRFELTPLRIVWHKAETPQIIELRNFWTLALLQPHLAHLLPPFSSWENLLERAESEFPHLTLLNTIADNLTGEPFNPTIADCAHRLLSILNELKTCFDEEGNRTRAGEEILEKYFHRKNAIFTDESDANKIAFHDQLTFKLPDGEMLFCPFHGKIRHRNFRLHFSWPIKRDEPLFVTYLGPKITKH